MALEEYFWLLAAQGEGEGGRQKVRNVKYFFQLEEELKFDLLSKLVQNAGHHLHKQSSKLKKQKQASKQKSQESGQQKGQKKQKQVQIQQIIILGQDNKHVYYFAPFLPTYILTSQMQNWSYLTKSQTISRIRSLLSQPMSSNNIFLCENLSKIVTRFMVEGGGVEKGAYQVEKAKEEIKGIVNSRVDRIRAKLLNIEERYSTFLKNFGNRCWGYYQERQQYKKSLSQSKTLQQLITCLKSFYKSTHKYLLICKSEIQPTQKINPQTDLQFLYKKQSVHISIYSQRPTCNINTVQVKINSSQCTVSSQYISWRMFGQEGQGEGQGEKEREVLDLEALFFVNVWVLGKALELLEEKQKNYWKKQEGMKRAREMKMKEASLQESQSDDISDSKQEEQVIQQSRVLRKKDKIVKYTNENSLKSMSSLSSLKPEPRQLRKKRPKKFGVTMLDSDQSQSQQSSQLKKKKSIDLAQYHYKKTKVQ